MEIQRVKWSILAAAAVAFTLAGAPGLRGQARSRKLIEEHVAVRSPDRAATAVTAMMTRSAPSVCTSTTRPIPVTEFLTTEPQAYLWFYVVGVRAGDVVSSEYYRPDGQLYTPLSGAWPKELENGDNCYTDVPFKIAGNLPATMPGTWTVKGRINSDLLFSFTFTVRAASGTCSYTINPTSQTVASGGASGLVTVNAGTNCQWTAASNASWVKVVSGASGVGAGTVNYSVEANPGAARTGSLTIAGQQHTIQQAGSSATASPQATIYMMTRAKPSVCNPDVPPVAESVFQTSDPQALLWFYVTGVQVGDVVASEYYSPDGQFYSPTSGSWDPSPNAGNKCFTDIPFKIAGDAPASMPGTWTVKGKLNGQTLFTLRFEIRGDTGACSFSLSPESWSLGASGGSASFAVNTAAGCAWTAASNAGWIKIQSGASGTGGGSVGYSVDANPDKTLRTGAITVAGANHTVTQAGASGSDESPVIAGGGVVSVATQQPKLSSGGWFLIRGTKLAATTRAWRDSDFRGTRLPLSLDGVSITVNGKPAAIYYISPTLVGAIAPEDNSEGIVTVALTNSLNLTATATVNFTAYTPGWFAFSGQGRRYAAGITEAGLLVGRSGIFGGAPSRVARPGDRLLLLASGLGPTDPAAPSDAVVDGAYSINADSVSVRIGDVPVTLEFAGLSPDGIAGLKGLVTAWPEGGRPIPGLYILMFVVPELPPNDYPITVAAGGVSSEPNVYLTVGSSSGTAISASPTSLQFTSTSSAQTISVTADSRVDFTAEASTASGGKWLSVTPANGSTPGSIRVSASAAGLAGGTYEGTIVITGPGVSEPLAVPVTLTVTSTATLSISSLSPTSAAKGATISSFVVNGTGLGSVTALRFNPATGITITNVRATATSVTAQVAIAADAAEGVRQVSVATATATSNALAFTVLPAATTATWQTDWAVFAKEVADFLATMKLDSGEITLIEMSKYSGKSAVWEGSVLEPDLSAQYPVVLMMMSPVTATLSNGAKTPVAFLGLYPSPSNLAKWRSVRANDRVRFRAYFSSIIGGVLRDSSGYLVLIMTDDAELLDSGQSLSPAELDQTQGTAGIPAVEQVETRLRTAARKLLSSR